MKHITIYRDFLLENEPEGKSKMKMLDRNKDFISELKILLDKENPNMVTINDSVRAELSKKDIEKIEEYLIINDIILMDARG